MIPVVYFLKHKASSIYTYVLPIKKRVWKARDDDWYVYMIVCTYLYLNDDSFFYLFISRLERLIIPLVRKRFKTTLKNGNLFWNNAGQILIIKSLIITTYMYEYKYIVMSPKKINK